MRQSQIDSDDTLPTMPGSQNDVEPGKVPAPGTENDDKNPPRIQPRNLFDASIGDDNLFHGDRYRWSLRLTGVNIANKYALYNFLSTFSGTHYVTPRAFRLKWVSTSSQSGTNSTFPKLQGRRIHAVTRAGSLEGRRLCRG